MDLTLSAHLIQASVQSSFLVRRTLKQRDDIAMHEGHKGSLLSWSTYSHETAWAAVDKLCWVCSMQLVIACSQQRIKQHTQKPRARHTVTIASKMSTRKHVFCGLTHPLSFGLVHRPCQQRVLLISRYMAKSKCFKSFPLKKINF